MGQNVNALIVVIGTASRDQYPLGTVEYHTDAYSFVLTVLHEQLITLRLKVLVNYVLDWGN